jgi:hypothetical protein
MPIYELNYINLLVAIADFLGWGRNNEGLGDDWDNQTYRRLDDVVDAGYMQFIYPPIAEGEKTAHRWSFLRPSATIDTEADSHRYELPANFGAIIGDMHYDPDELDPAIIRHTSPGRIDSMRSIDSMTGRPAWFAIRPISVESATPQLSEVIFHKIPDAIYTICYYYDAKVEKLSSIASSPLGGQPHAETIIQSCRNVAAQRYKDDPAGREHDLFMQRLQASIEYDRRNSPEYLGVNNDGNEIRIGRHGDNFSVSLTHNLGGG